MNRLLIASVMVGSLLVVISAHAQEGAKEKTKIDLGGVRQATATIAIEGDAYVIQVRFLPSKALSPATSANINYKLADSYCFRALHRYLRVERSVVSGKEIVGRGKDGEFVTYNFSIPKKGVKLEKAAPAP